MNLGGGIVILSNSFIISLVFFALGILILLTKLIILLNK